MKKLPAAVVAIIQNENGKILGVSRKDDWKDFGLPGGKVEEGETPWEALKREVSEEVGLTISNPREIFRTIRPSGREAVAYLVDWEGEIYTEENHQVKWCSWERLEKGSFGEFNRVARKRLELYKKGELRIIEERPWGNFEILKEGEDFKTKFLTVDPGKRLSLQYHLHREEVWIVIQGEAVAQLENEEVRLEKGEIFKIPKGALHRLSNRGTEPLVIFELQSGEYLGEDDIIRIADDTGRK